MYYIYDPQERAYLMGWQWSPTGFRTGYWSGRIEDAMLFGRVTEAAGLARGFRGAEVWLLGRVDGRFVTRLVLEQGVRW